ncbi:MAG: archaellin/type IV pilin N-terminal domain-containing protein [Nanoarchaeota archaeon]
MRVKKFRKKGVSPLIATTLLVGFTVAVVAMVVVWSRGYIEERAQKEEALANTKLKCENVRFTVEKSCLTAATGYLDIDIKNQATQQIDSFILRIKGPAGVEAVEEGPVSGPIKGLQTGKMNLGPEKFDVTKVGVGGNTVEIIPMIKAGKGKYVPCSGQMLEARMLC